MNEQSYLHFKYIPNRIASSSISKTSEEIESLKREFVSILPDVVEYHVKKCFSQYITNTSIEHSLDFITQAKELVSGEDKLNQERIKKWKCITTRQLK